MAISKQQVIENVLKERKDINRQANRLTSELNVLLNRMALHLGFTWDEYLLRPDVNIDLEEARFIQGRAQAIRTQLIGLNSILSDINNLEAVDGQGDNDPVATRTNVDALITGQSLDIPAYRNGFLNKD